MLYNLTTWTYIIILIRYSMGMSWCVSTLTAGLCVSVDSQKHIPSFIENAKEIKSKGVSDIIVISGLWLANALSNFLYGCDQWFRTRHLLPIAVEITLYRRFLKCLYTPCPILIFIWLWSNFRMILSPTSTVLAVIVVTSCKWFLEWLV
jgi:hypothetical protein